MKVNSKVLDALTDFIVNYLEGKTLDGITYVLALNSDKVLIDKCNKIKQLVLDSGFGKNEVFRVYKLSNGYIYDMDLSVVKYISQQLTAAVARQENIKLDSTDIISDLPEKRRREDIQSLAKYCKSQYEKGKNKFDVALFSRNMVQKIVINGNSGKDKVMLSYNAYAIRHWDMEALNNIMIPTGLRVESIVPCEILPSKTGVRFEITVARAY